MLFCGDELLAGVLVAGALDRNIQRIYEAFIKLNDGGVTLTARRIAAPASSCSSWGLGLTPEWR